MGHGFNNYGYAHRAAGGLAAAAAQIYSGSRTKTIMAPPGEQPINTEVGEYTRYSKKSGRYKKRTLQRLWQLNRINQQIVQIRYQGVNPWATATAGYFPLYNYQNTTNNQFFYPIYLFDLTGFYNLNGVTLAEAPVCYALSAFTAGPGLFDYTWNQVSGTAADGTTTSPLWRLENAPGNLAGASNAPLRSSVRRWIDLRMMLYGSTTNTTKYDISVVQFESPEWDPLYLQYVAAQGGGTLTDPATQIAFHQFLLAQYTYNPIMVQNNAMAKRIKFLKRYQCIIQPQESTEGANLTGHQRQLNWFMKDDKICRYDWNDSGVAPGVSSLTTGDGYAQNIAQCQNNVEWPKRKYLLVRATSKLRTGAGSPAPNVLDPSFDLILRANHRINV